MLFRSAELVLSINGSNVEVARDLGCQVVVTLDDPPTLGGLDRTIERLEAWRVPYRIDPVLEPIGFGLSASLGRYLDVRRRYPAARMMMGIGNLTELTDSDSAGLNVLLIGFCQELGITSVLTTEVINWARSSVREIDLARRLAYYACQNRVLPKHLEPRLIMLRDEKIREHGAETLRQLARQIKDPNFRIFAEGGQIHVMNSDMYLTGTDPFELFNQMQEQMNRAGGIEADHAFYLGYETAKAVTALALSKQYTQDQPLDWGFLTLPEAGHADRRRDKKDA